MRKFNELPEKIQNDVKSYLKAYDVCDVVFEDGAYRVGGGVCIQAEYAPDHEYLGCYKAEDLFTPEERILNYVEAFHEYPLQYTGRRDYKMMREVAGNWAAKFGFDEAGNIVRA